MRIHAETCVPNGNRGVKNRVILRNDVNPEGMWWPVKAPRRAVSSGSLWSRPTSVTRMARRFNDSRLRAESRAAKLAGLADQGVEVRRIANDERRAGLLRPDPDLMGHRRRTRGGVKPDTHEARLDPFDAQIHIAGSSSRIAARPVAKRVDAHSWRRRWPRLAPARWRARFATSRGPQVRK